MAETQPENIAGALIFWVYICAAICFSCFIILDIVGLRTTSRDVNSKSKTGGQRESPQRSRRVRLFILLTILSFITLSYHMLSFLLVSYETWSMETRAGHKGSTSVREFIQRVWLWSKSSTLFQDFATVICNSPRRFWWTQQALLYSFAWNIFMRIEGLRHEIPHLWAYFVLGQILPISFTQNLFSIALLLKPYSMKNINLTSSDGFQQWLLAALFLCSLLVAPLAAGTPFYLASLLITRILLFAPYLLIKQRRQSIRQETSSYEAAGVFGPSTLPLLAGLFLPVYQTIQAGSPFKILRALHDSHAVSALGYDYLIGLMSAWCLSSSLNEVR